jgi:hypothetical protein
MDPYALWSNVDYFNYERTVRSVCDLYLCFSQLVCMSTGLSCDLAQRCLCRPYLKSLLPILYSACLYGMCLLGTISHSLC